MEESWATAALRILSHEQAAEIEYNTPYLM